MPRKHEVGFSLRLTPEEMEQARQNAEQEDRSINSYLRTLIRRDTPARQIELPAPKKRAAEYAR